MSKQYKKGITIGATLAVLIGASFSFFLWNQRKTETPHYVDEACAVCHAYVQHSCTSANCVECHPLFASDLSAYRQLKAPELELCTACHEHEGETEVPNAEGFIVSVDLGRSHPWGVVPDATNTPATLPLTGGMITCMTCHDVHAPNVDAPMLRIFEEIVDGEGERRFSFTPLCHDCHEGY